MSEIDDPPVRHASAIVNAPDKGWDDQPEEKRLPDNDPTEFLPVMRHHLHEALWANNMALSYIQATDLADSYRRGLTMPQESPLAKQLERSQLTLSGYLGLLDDEEDEDEDEDGVSEEQ